MVPKIVNLRVSSIITYIEPHPFLTGNLKYVFGALTLHPSSILPE